MDLYLVTPGFEDALRAELAESRTLAPGLVEASAPATRDPVFSRQRLPDARAVEGASVAALAEAAYASLEGAIDAWPGPFVVHAVTPPPAPAPDAPTVLPGARLAHSRALKKAKPDAKPEASKAEAVLERRAALVEAAFVALVEARRKRASRRRRPAEAPGPFDETVLLVQMLAATRERFFVSAAAPRALPRGGFDLAPWPAGAPPVAEDRTPPSRAYRKLEEAFAWMGAAPRAGETCVDLGAAPGSWTVMAARRGARVVAIDRAPLAPAVARLPGVSTIAGNAFTYEPPAPVDWLLSDIVCEPERAIALVDAWLGAGRCRQLVVTVKFRGREQYGTLAALEPIFARAAPAFARVKQLAHNKNEVTVMVRRTT
ncbi:MAG TPA: SAM-dependent methyltransferase [Polyangia bacterium]|nr:SAM-dependent methyltransferase [Polyangia bacterium]